MPNRIKVEAGYPCKKFHEIYADGKELIEKMWGDAFVYETNLSKAYSLWFFGENPNNAVNERIFGTSDVEHCHLNYYHKDSPPSPEESGMHECHPWKENSCCHKDTVDTAEGLRDGYGPEYHWDRCGPLSPACERFFVQEACAYECEPAFGLFRRYAPNIFNASDPTHNEWEVYKMPIRADHADAWFHACYNDHFCAADDGNFFSCAATYLESVTDTDEGNLSGGAAAAIIVPVLIVLLAAIAFILHVRKTERLSGASYFVSLDSKGRTNPASIPSASTKEIALGNI